MPVDPDIPDTPTSFAVDTIRDHYAGILAMLPLALASRSTIEGTLDTPRRAADALLELTSGYYVDVPSLFVTFDAEGYDQYDQMIVADPIPFASLCEHHILPFTGTVGIAYVPDGRIIGLSKLPRLVDAHARRLQVQERLTESIANDLMRYLEPKGVAVVVKAEHHCATLRGVRKAGMMMQTSALRGVLYDKPEARAEALALLGR
jgi:GTP cyclohydrolase I